LNSQYRSAGDHPRISPATPLENIRKMREADQQFRREVEAQRRCAGIRREKRLSGGDRLSPSLRAGQNRMMAEDISKTFGTRILALA